MKKIITAFVVLAFVILLFVDMDKKSKAARSEAQPVKLSRPGAPSNSAPSNAAQSNPGMGDAPDFELPKSNGGTLKFSDYKGKVIILDFWATWCPPCKAEIPFFIELYKQYKKDGLVVIGCAIDEEAKVKQFIKQHGINYPVALSDRNVPNKFGGVRGLPTTFVIDRNGKIQRKYVGFRPKKIFEDDFFALK